MKRYKQLLIFVLLAFLFGMVACERVVEDDRANPFDMDTGEIQDSSSLSPSSLAGLHQNVFSTKCANPTCHDGSFEPDFRTIQSTYASLVYHPVIKNDDNNSFDFRVVPGDADASWLMRRVTVDDVLGKMPLYAPSLSDEEVENIRKWINNGAQDILGTSGTVPNLPPTFLGFAAYDQNLSRIDRNRIAGPASPFVLPMGTSMTLAIVISDDSTSTLNLKNQRVDFTFSKDDYSQATSLLLTYFSQGVVTATVDANNFLSDTTIYFRYYGEDEKGASLTMPEANSPYYFKDVLSFIIQ